jgi:hypothetical protein
MLPADGVTERCQQHDDEDEDDVTVACATDDGDSPDDSPAAQY